MSLFSDRLDGCGSFSEQTRGNDRRACPSARRRTTTALRVSVTLTALLLFAIASLRPLPGVARAPDQSPLSTALQSVVSILPEWPPDKKRNEEPEASGVVWQDGNHIVTAYHVVANARSIRVRTHDGYVLRATLAGSDPATDLAVLRIDESLPASKLATGTPGLGQRVCAIGNAFGLGLSVTCGVVSAVNRAGVGFNPIEDFIQTDAAVNPGASGGALVAEDGTVVGILSAIFTKKADANIGVNFAVSMPLAARIADQLIASGRVEHSKTGLRLAPSDALASRSARALLAPRVTRVFANSPAERAGIKIGDQIVEAAGRRIRTPAEFVSASASSVARVDVVVIRDGTRHKFTIDRAGKASE